ncbi:MAG: hypothetical protein BWY59_01962 [Verrucomicrobia bacterium ADurb.Bin345]|nr:MAG: hypothetical protein BWY59_01962 [Verrucomicrobia bacterium ADurb.Bin345]
MTCKADRHKPSNRPKKSDAERRKRLKVQKKRLVALGLPAEQVEKLDPSVVRTLLKRPAKIAKK